jgi:hypothetical protein
MRLVMLESPWRGDVLRNRAYAIMAMRDSIARGEAPYASHMMIAGHDILDDDSQSERDLGIAIGTAWLKVCEAIVVYCDYGISGGMQHRIDIVRADHLMNVVIEYRKILP